MKTFSPQQVYALEQLMEQNGVSTEELMKRAGYEIFRGIKSFAESLHADFCRRIVFLVGKGRNGGDALLAAQHVLKNMAVEVVICRLAPFKSMTTVPDFCFTGFEKSAKIFEIEDEIPEELLTQGTIFVDGLFGIGFKGEIRGHVCQWIERLNQRGLPVIAIDIPSGLNGETGEIASVALQADLTICLGVWKQGLFSDTGRKSCGRLHLADIGFSTIAEQAEGGAISVFDIEDARQMILRRPVGGNKYTFGSVAIVAGSTAYPGAPVLSAEGALRTGCGYVTLMVPYGVRSVLPPRSAAVVVREISGEFGYLSKQSFYDVETMLGRAQSIVFGPGVGRKSQTTEMVTEIFSSCQNAVIDADGLWHMMVSKQFCGDGFVITPHAGEVEMLLKDAALDSFLSASRVEQAQALAAYYGCVVVYKGLGTIIADETRAVVISTGNSALATAGTGDVLSGMIASLMAQRYAPFDAAALACWMHGRVAELYPHGMRTMIADDLGRYLGDVFKELTPYF